MENNFNLVKDLRALIAKDQLDEVLKRLLLFLPDKDKRLYHTAIVTVNKHERIKSDQSLGIINNEELENRKSNLVNSILYIIEELTQIPDYSIPLITFDRAKAELLLKRKDWLIDKLGFLYDRLYKTSNHNQEYEIKTDIESLKNEIANIENEIKKVHE